MPFVYPDTPPPRFLSLSAVPSWSSFLNGTIFDGLFYLEFGGFYSRSPHYSFSGSGRWVADRGFARVFSNSRYSSEMLGSSTTILIAK